VAMMTERANSETAETDRSKPYLHSISATLREIVGAMDEIVWTINPRNDSLDNLANYVFQYAQEYFQNTPVRCRLDVPPELPDLPVSTGQRHNLFMAIKEGLNNILKHSGASEARVRVASEDGLLRIEIADNGRGIDPARSAAGGHGLTNMRERLAQIGGRLTIQSRPGEGTTLTMEVRPVAADRKPGRTGPAAHKPGQS
jgi:signal transduction histidine kinase